MKDDWPPARTSATIGRNKECPMPYTLYLGDAAYSSWSLRGWLLLDAFDVPFRAAWVPMYSDDFTAMQARNAPARTVPALEIGDRDALVWESLAIAETLAERHPDAPYWPTDTAARGAARSLSGEMHAGFRALRDRPSMNLRRRYSGFEPTEAENADAVRVQALWSWALRKFGGPYLGGAAFGAVDAMFAPVATRFVTYGFALETDAARYVEAIYAHPSFRRWHAMADADPRVLDRYDLDISGTGPLGTPRPAPMPAERYAGAASEAINAACPYSGNPVQADSLARIGGQVVGFCNPFCRDKSVADAAAWPALMALLKDGP